MQLRKGGGCVLRIAVSRIVVARVKGSSRIANNAQKTAQRKKCNARGRWRLRQGNEGETAGDAAKMIGRQATDRIGMCENGFQNAAYRGLN